MGQYVLHRAYVNFGNEPPGGPPPKPRIPPRFGSGRALFFYQNVFVLEGWILNGHDWNPSGVSLLAANDRIRNGSASNGACTINPS